MHSYTFNFETGQFERGIPRRPWTRIAWFVVAAVILGVSAWEYYWRQQGYQASYDPTDNLWAEFRHKAQHAGPEYTIITGSSRALFDIDLPTWRRVMGNEHLIQLAKEGASPLPIVGDLIENTRFAGTLVVSVAPDLFFSTFGMNDEWSTGLVRHYNKWSPADRIEHQADLLVEPLFGFIQMGELDLSTLLSEIPLKNRPDYQMGFARVPKLSDDTRERQAKMWSKVVTDTAYAHRVRAIWLGFHSRTGPLMRPDDYAAKTAETFAGKFMPAPPPLVMRPGERDSFYQQIRTWADTLRQRGGKIIFIRPPSDGVYRELEEFDHPRKDTWDVLLARTQAPGVHYEDYPELQGFELPEWSHLRAEHAPLFTEALAKIVKEKLRE